MKRPRERIERLAVMAIIMAMNWLMMDTEAFLLSSVVVPVLLNYNNYKTNQQPPRNIRRSILLFGTTQDDSFARVEIKDDDDDDPIWREYNANIDAFQKQDDEKQALIQEAQTRRELREQGNSLGIIIALTSVVFGVTVACAGDALFTSNSGSASYRRGPPAVIDANQLLQNDFARLESSVEFGVEGTPDEWVNE